MKRKLLIVTPGYHPAKNYGGPVISISNIVASFYKEYDISILTSNCEFKDNKRLIQDNSFPIEVNKANVYYLDINQMTRRYLENLIYEIRPDVIYINSLFHYKLTIPVLKICKRLNIRHIIAPRGALCENALKFGKRKKMVYVLCLKFGRLFENSVFQSTSKEETVAIKKYLCNDLERIYEISNLPAPFFNENKHCVKQPGCLKIVFFSRIHPKKNLMYAIETLREVKGNIQFDIYGPIEVREYWDLCKAEIKKCNKNIKVAYCGYLEHNDIPNTLRQYHLFFFPTLSENYGHVIVEALESKCLVLLSNNTPWNDVEEYNVGRAISLDDRSAFVRYINELVDMDDEEITKCVDSINPYLEQKLQINNLHIAYKGLFG